MHQSKFTKEQELEYALFLKEFGSVQGYTTKDIRFYFDQWNSKRVMLSKSKRVSSSKLKFYIMECGYKVKLTRNYMILHEKSIERDRIINDIRIGALPSRAQYFVNANIE